VCKPFLVCVLSFAKKRLNTCLKILEKDNILKELLCITREKATNMQGFHQLKMHTETRAPPQNLPFEAHLVRKENEPHRVKKEACGKSSFSKSQLPNYHGDSASWAAICQATQRLLGK
jgi:hypothetical protein